MISLFQEKQDFFLWIEKRRISFEEENETVREVIRTVAERGDEAVREYTHKFDRIDIKDFLLSTEEAEEAWNRVSPDLIRYLEKVKNNIFEYHLKQLPSSWYYRKDGKLLGQKVTPLEKVGLYIPGGKGIYPSTVLMTAVPAKIAGVEKIVMITPPGPDGKIQPVVAAAAQICGVDMVYKVGGVQGVAALAFGTRQIPAVDKIVGPGNKYVTLAKKYLYGRIDIDSLAGPSEVMILADEQVPLKYIVADMLAQAEHSEDAQSIVLVPSVKMADALTKELKKSIQASPRKVILESSIQENSCMVLYSGIQEAYELINFYGPEHLEILLETVSDEELLKNIRNAGAIFIGPYTPVALGDYFAGPNHTLPTNGTARYASPLGVYDFVKFTSVIKYNREQLMRERDYAASIAEVESFVEHAQSLKVRD